jgi:predicted CXXCH cytochrome family protein
MCHDVEDTDLIETHLQADLATLECTNCHTTHGAGNEKLLAQHVHPPVLEDCAICHEGSSSELMEDGESALCLICHQGIGELAAQASVPHGALEIARCVECHNPHASKQEHLVKAPGAGPCVDCHDDKAPSEGEFGHGAIELVGCRACHEPHGSENPTLLRQTGNELCLGCHDARGQGATDGVVRLADRFDVTEEEAASIRRVLLDSSRERGHPITNHPIVGRAEVHGRVQVTFDGELSCLTCHDPHKGPSQRMFRWGASSTAEACLECHPK